MVVVPDLHVHGSHHIHGSASAPPPVRVFAPHGRLRQSRTLGSDERQSKP